jgi:hypothetical protein
MCPVKPIDPSVYACGVSLSACEHLVAAGSLGCLYLQATCSNTDLSRPGPKPFQCPAGMEPRPANAMSTDVSEDVCCQVSCGDDWNCAS